MHLLQLWKSPSSLQDLEAQRQQLLSEIKTKVDAAKACRKNLRKAKVQKEVKQFNPRFEEDSAAERDYDPDRCSLLPLD